MALRSNLIFDMGLHKGEDTAFYLKKGFHVVAFEADPELLAHCKVRFREPIACGRLQIVQGAIAPEGAGTHVAFYKNAEKSVWGTIDANWVQRNAKLGTHSVRIEVKRVDAIQTFRTYGIPYYLKVDIEGADHLVLLALRDFEERPPYVSLEADTTVPPFMQVFADLKQLYELGYRRFKPVQQASIPGRRLKTTNLEGMPVEHVFEFGASGPFGDDLPGPWLSCDECAEEYRRIIRRSRLFGDTSLLRRLPGGSRFVQVLGYFQEEPLVDWYDTHASLH